MKKKLTSDVKFGIKQGIPSTIKKESIGPNASFLASLGLLKSIGLKATESRLAILDIFNKSLQPISVHHILDTLKDKKLKTNETTIYRFIDSLIKQGSIKKINRGANLSLFEIVRCNGKLSCNNSHQKLDQTHLHSNQHPHHHPHHHLIVCNKCGLTETFSVCMIGDSILEIKNNSKNFKNIIDHSFELFGICNKCFKKTN